ncbi:MAG: efflux RND transporter periplasmic adaptor subunit [Elusimicrobia bacterium]|nr:efflux RND transporter periplasmic adaptor subunit [Elusimicrobiota bacterium]
MTAPASRLPLGLIAVAWACVTAANIALGYRLRVPEVRVERLRAAPMTLVLRAPGTIQPLQNVVLKAAFDAPILKKDYAEGHEVKAGQTLVELGRDAILGSYNAKVNEDKNARRELTKAEKEVGLQTRLYKRGAVAEMAVAEAERNVERAREAAALAALNLQREQELWDKNVVRAPFSGTVTKDFLGAEPQIAAGKELLAIGNLSAYGMLVKVDEVDIGSVRVGQAAQIRLQAHEDTLLDAVVDAIGAHSDDKGGSQYLVTLKIPRTGGLPLMPQFTGEARILVGETEPVLSVPASALSSKDGRWVVWVVAGAARLRAVPVGVGRSTPERVEITGGLAEGQRVCAVASASLKAGALVKPRE